MAELQGRSDVRSPSFWDVPCLRSQDIPGIGTDAESDPPSPGPSTAPYCCQATSECHSTSMNLSFFICGLGMIRAPKNAVGDKAHARHEVVDR